MNIVSIRTTSVETKKEIIEIGICKFDVKTHAKYDLLSLFVKPIDTKLTEYCTKITGVTAEDLSSAVSFFDMIEFLRENYQSEELPWASFGNLPEQTFKHQCRNSGVKFPFSDRFLNVRHLFALQNSGREVSLKEALAEFGIHYTPNSSEDDVLNTGIILSKILK